MTLLLVSTANSPRRPPSRALLPAHHERATKTRHRPLPPREDARPEHTWRKRPAAKTNAFYSPENKSDDRCESSSVGLGKKGYPGGVFFFFLHNYFLEHEQIILNSFNDACVRIQTCD